MFQIDPASHTPIYAQLVEQVRDGVTEGRLRPGDRLPSIRSVADSLRVSPNTVIRAYRELVAAGVARVRRGTATFIADPDRLRPGQRRALGEQLVREMLERAARLGLTPCDLLALLEPHLPTQGPKGRS